MSPYGTAAVLKPLTTAEDSATAMDAERTAQINEFLARMGWAGAEWGFLAGDASFRHYERVRLNGRSAVLMDAPPDKEPLAPFLTVASYLLEAGYSAPEILGVDAEAGLLLLEDFGDASYTRYLQENPLKEMALYKEAVNLLASMHKSRMSAASLPPYNRDVILREASLFVEWYLPQRLGIEGAAAQRETFLTLWNRIFDTLPQLPDVPVLRDFHADNLMWLPERQATSRVGLLDFQDALIGSPAYDLVSLLEDARRDIAPETAQMALNHYLQQSSWVDKKQFLACYAVWGAQRNTKIIGIFCRLAERDGKRHYLDYLPRVWNHLRQDLQHPLLRQYREWLAALLPDAGLQIKRKAG